MAFAGRCERFRWPDDRATSAFAIIIIGADKARARARLLGC